MACNGATVGTLVLLMQLSTHHILSSRSILDVGPMFAVQEARVTHTADIQGGIGVSRDQGLAAFIRILNLMTVNDL